jgi:hypothetical protein
MRDDCSNPWLTGHDDADFQSLVQAIQHLAEQQKDDCSALLALLRTLEKLHQQIRETLFREALPTNRQALYHLLKEIEVNGGWPYIQRMKLVEFLAALEVAAPGSDLGTAATTAHELSSEPGHPVQE